MSLKYLKKLHPILNKAGKKHGISVEEGEFIIGKFFESFKNALTDPRIPKVYLPLIGIFKPKLGKIHRSLKASIRFHRLGGTTREYLNARIRRLWPIRDRLIQESRGKITWNSWRKDEVKQKFIELDKNEQEEKKRSKSIVYGTDNNLEESWRVLREIQTGLRAKGGKKREP